MRLGLVSERMGHATTESRFLRIMPDSWVDLIMSNIELRDSSRRGPEVRFFDSFTCRVISRLDLTFDSATGRQLGTTEYLRVR